MALPLGIALPAKAEKAADSTAITGPAEETPISNSSSRESQTFAVNPSETHVPSDDNTPVDEIFVRDWNGDGEDILVVVHTITVAGSVKATSPAVKKPTGAQVLAYARSFEGKVPYVHGGKAPGGWDCIGMIRYVYEQFGAAVGPRPVSVLEAGRQVPYSKAKPGDLLYWPAERTMIGTNDHVGIYIDAKTNFGAGRSKETSVVTTKWKGDPPIVIRVFE